MSEQFDVALLSRYQPLDSLNPDNLQKIIKQLKLEKIPAGENLFIKGETKPVQYYLVKGEVDLFGDSRLLKTIKSETPDSYNALAHILPRTVTATAKVDSLIFKIDCNLIEVMLTWDQTGSYHISEFGTGTDNNNDEVITRILQTDAFQHIPQTNTQAIHMLLETVPVKAGETVVTQGEQGDFFYIIKKGRALVTRSLHNLPQGIKLAELKEGDMFGEEALISDEKRNATITMLTNGMVSRLSKKNFQELLNEPLLNWVSYTEGKQLVKDGAEWLDVRLPAEHQSSSISGDSHIPLIFLRIKIDSINNNKPYVIYCDSGRRSSTASFLLNERGFTTYILEDGIGSVPVEDLQSCKSRKK